MRFFLIIGICVILSACNSSPEFKTKLALAKAGNMDAQNWVGAAYYRGDLAKLNYEKAYHWFSLSAKNGNGKALRNLGIMHEYGKGTEVNNQKAKSYYDKAYNAGEKEAALNLGDFYAKNGNYRSALHYFEVASNNGFEEADEPLVKLEKWIAEDEASELVKKKSSYEMDMRLKCEMEIEDIGVWGVKFPLMAGRPAIDNDCVMETKRCAFRWSKGQVKFRNEYGTWQNVSADCFTHKGAIDSLKINNVKIK